MACDSDFGWIGRINKTHHDLLWEHIGPCTHRTYFSHCFNVNNVIESARQSRSAHAELDAAAFLLEEGLDWERFKEVQITDFGCKPGSCALKSPEEVAWLNQPRQMRRRRCFKRKCGSLSVSNY